MKKYILSVLTVLAATTLFTSCNSMLDTDPRKTEMTKATFPGKAGDIDTELAGIYTIMNVLGGGDSDSWNPFYWWEIMSDNCYGSGGLQDDKVKAMHHLVQQNANQWQNPYIALYGGIKRCNDLIETIDNVPWDEDQKEFRNQVLGEGYFMRGLYTLWLTQMFGDVPLITASDVTPEMEEQVSAEEVIYPQIIADFISGKNLMGTTRGRGDGHANKFVAEAFLARAYMFWAGFYMKKGELAVDKGPDIQLVGRDGAAIEQEGCNVTSVSQKNVEDALKDIVTNGGYQLCEDFRSLWQYSNSYVYNEGKYEFIKDMDPKNCFDKPGMGNGNTEELFQIQFMNASHWNIPITYYSQQRQYCNYLSVFWGLRCNGDNGKVGHTYPFNQGWGQGTPSCNLWDDWSDAENTGGYKDIRKLGSLIDCVNELADYTFEKDDCEESGYAVKKYNAVTVMASGDSFAPWWCFTPNYSSSSLDNKMQGDNFEDFYLMRYADVLLMLTELTGDAQYMNEVQRRAGVPETAYSLKAVQNERRWEFAFEGLRFNDLRRWSGKDANESSLAARALQAQDGKMIVVRGKKDARVPMHHMTSSWAKRYAATKGFLAKPQEQINLMAGKLTQNEGWDGSEETQYVSLY